MFSTCLPFRFWKKLPLVLSLVLCQPPFLHLYWPVRWKPNTWHSWRTCFTLKLNHYNQLLGWLPILFFVVRCFTIVSWNHKSSYCNYWKTFWKQATTTQTSSVLERLKPKGRHEVTYLDSVMDSMDMNLS